MHRQKDRNKTNFTGFELFDSVPYVVSESGDDRLSD